MAKAGQPTKYDPKYCQQMIGFFSVESSREVVEIVTFKDGTTKETIKELANKLPHFSKFALSINVHVDTLHEWCKVHEEFSEAYKICKDLQKTFLIDNGLLGLFNSTAYIFTAKNITDMRDQQEVKHSGDAENPVRVDLQGFFKVETI